MKFEKVYCTKETYERLKNNIHFNKLLGGYDEEKKSYYYWQKV